MNREAFLEFCSAATAAKLIRRHTRSFVRPLPEAPMPQVMDGDRMSRALTRIATT